MENKNSNYYNDLNDFKPRKWLLVILIVIAISISVVLANKVIVSFKNWNDNFLNSNSSSNLFDETKNKIEEETRKMEVESFNRNFEINVGSKNGITVKHLLDDVIINNKKNSEHLLIVEYDTHSTSDPEEIKNFKSEFDDWTKYEVSIDYNEEGYANKITIEK